MINPEKIQLSDWLEEYEKKHEFILYQMAYETYASLSSSIYS